MKVTLDLQDPLSVKSKELIIKLNLNCIVLRFKNFINQLSNWDCRKVVRPVLLYEAECWTIKISHVQKMRSCRDENDSLDMWPHET